MQTIKQKTYKRYIYLINSFCKLTFLGWSQFPPIFEKRLFESSTRTEER